MTSMATVGHIGTYALKGLGLLAPVAYKLWSSARKRPIVYAERAGEKVSIRCNAQRPIASLAIRLCSEAGITPEAVAVPTKEFTGAESMAVGDYEVRVSFKRFSSHDVVRVHCPETLLVEVLDSDAIPVMGAPRRGVWVIDYLVVVAALLVIVLLVWQPAEAWLVEPSYQSQDNVNHLLIDTIERMVTGLSLATLLFVGAAFALPGRARLFLGKRSMRV